MTQKHRLLVTVLMAVCVVVGYAAGKSDRQPRNQTPVQRGTPGSAECSTILVDRPSTEYGRKVERYEVRRALPFDKGIPPTHTFDPSSDSIMTLIDPDGLKVVEYVVSPSR